MMNKYLFSSFIFITALHTSDALAGETHIITASRVSFSPTVTLIEPGDSVHWKGMSVHSTGILADMLPPGAEGWESPIGEDFEKTFTQQGIYIFRCKPHGRLGMAGAIIVGKPENIESIKAANAEQQFEEVIKQAILEAESTSAQ
jgi:pseudoazurin